MPICSQYCFNKQFSNMYAVLFRVLAQVRFLAHLGKLHDGFICITFHRLTSEKVFTRVQVLHVPNMNPVRGIRVHGPHLCIYTEKIKVFKNKHNISCHTMGCVIEKSHNHVTKVFIICRRICVFLSVYACASNKRISIGEVPE